jgi:serine acetyltransferase
MNHITHSHHVVPDVLQIFFSLSAGVTLGGTGKEKGNRHPKIQNGVIIYDGGAILGNIIIGEGSIITAKSIVTKPIPPLAIVSGVPAKITGYRTIMSDDHRIIFNDPLQEHLHDKYFQSWEHFEKQRLLDDDQNSI